MTTLLAPLRIEARYTRSVHLQRDFGSRASLAGYQVIYKPDVTWH